MHLCHLSFIVLAAVSLQGVTLEAAGIRQPLAVGP